MATNFPTGLDSLTNPTSSDSLSSPSHSAQHANVNDAVEALQAKVGVDSSAVTSSLDYKIAQLPVGQLAIATSTADFTATTSGIDILNTSVTLTSSRILRITFFVGAISSPSTNLEAIAYILDGPVATGTRLNTVNERMGTAFDVQVVSAHVVYSATFSAGTHDFYGSGLASTGTCNFNGDVTRPHLLIVDDMGAG